MKAKSFISFSSLSSLLNTSTSEFVGVKVNFEETPDLDLDGLVCCESWVESSCSPK